jgi:nitroreductase
MDNPAAHNAAMDGRAMTKRTMTERTTDVFAAVDSRISCRWFLDTPVDAELVRDLIARAARAASGGNLQPWQVYALTGAALADLKRQVATSIAGRDPRQEAAEYPIVGAVQIAPRASWRAALWRARDRSRRCRGAACPIQTQLRILQRAGRVVHRHRSAAWARAVGGSRRLHPRFDVSGARSRSRYLRAGILGAHASHRRPIRQNAAGADAVLRGLHRLWRSQPSGQQLSFAARRARGILPVFGFD